MWISSDEFVRESFKPIANKTTKFASLKKVETGVQAKKKKLLKLLKIIRYWAIVLFSKGELEDEGRRKLYLISSS